MARLFAFFLIALCVSVSQCVEVTKTCSTLDSGDVEVVLTFAKSSSEVVSDVVFHDSLPVHAEVKEGELVGTLKVPFSSCFLPYSTLILLINLSPFFSFLRISVTPPLFAMSSNPSKWKWVSPKGLSTWTFPLPPFLTSPLVRMIKFKSKPTPPWPPLPLASPRELSSYFF